MVYRILVAADGSAQADKAMNAAIQLAQRNPVSTIIGLSVTRPMPAGTLLAGSDMVDYELHEHHLAQSRIERMADQARAAGVPCKTLIEYTSLAPDDIARLAISHNCDCVFLACRDSSGPKNSGNGHAPWKALAEASIPAIIYR